MGSHYVPQSYLKGFQVVDDPGMTWAYDKVQKEFKKLPIKAVAQGADYYDPRDEAELNRLVEAPAHAVLVKLGRRERMTADERFHLAAYVATMLYRGPRKRRRGEEGYPKVLAQTFKQARADLRRRAGEAGADALPITRQLDELDELEERFTHEKPAEVTDRIRSPWPSEAVVKLLWAMTWRLAQTPPDSHGFVTSDNPACFFEGLGLKNRECEVTFPLTKDLVLLASWQGSQADTEYLGYLKPFFVREVNRRVASSAERFLFHPRKERWLPLLAAKSHHLLSRIVWTP